MNAIMPILLGKAKTFLPKERNTNHTNNLLVQNNTFTIISCDKLNRIVPFILLILRSGKLPTYFENEAVPKDYDQPIVLLFILECTRKSHAHSGLLRCLLSTCRNLENINKSKCFGLSLVYFFATAVSFCRSCHANLSLVFLDQ